MILKDLFRLNRAHCFDQIYQQLTKKLHNLMSKLVLKMMHNRNYLNKDQKKTKFLQMTVEVKLAEGYEVLPLCGTPDINQQTSAHLRPDQSLKNQETVEQQHSKVVVGK